MLKDEYKNKLIEILDENKVSFDVPMSEWTSFKTGGNAECMIHPKTEEEIIEVIKFAKENDIPYYILGNGTNTLVRDGGIKGIIIGLYQNFNSIDIDEETGIVRVKAGTLLSAVANLACRAGLSGIEFAGGIPGCIGGAIKMNAGAYEGEMKDIVEKVKILHEDLSVKEYTNEEMQFGYRTSIVKDTDIVLEISIKLVKKETSKIRSKMVELAKKRKEKQPLNLPSAGSAFKRPKGNYAGKLIQEAGLQGYTVGGAQVSKKHAGFVVNTGKATAEDVETILKDIQDKVYEKHKVELEKEIIIIGDKDN
ncbi:MAG: UDP-N-acetylmuramate dehydrogenase [Eubacteriales bacterium]